MKRNFITLMLFSVLTSMAAPAFAFNLFGLNKDADIQQMLEYIPSDSPLFLGAVTNPKMLASTEGFYSEGMAANMQQDLDELSSLMGDSANATFAIELLRGYYQNLTTGGVAVYEHYGFDTQGASAFYLDGLFPVLRISLSDEKQFIEVLNQAATAAQVELVQSELGGSTLYSANLVAEEDDSLSLGITTANKTLTISFYTQKDDTVAMLSRFAFAPPSDAYGKAAWKNLASKYEFNREMRGFIDFPKLVKALSAGQGRASAQLMALLSETESPIPQQCTNDALAMANAVPMWAFGYSKTDYSGEFNEAQIKSVLELENTQLVSELIKLRGFLPSYIEQGDLAIGMALGLDMNALVPSLTAIWQQFTNAEFECDAFLEAQASVSQLNPAMLGMVTGMTNGLKGISAGLFDFSGNLENGDANIDAIVSLSAEQPQTLASLLSTYLPQLGGQTIPSDGTSIEVALPMLSQPIQVAIKGNHLTAFMGQQANQTADKLAEEALSTNGLASLTLNYSRFGQLMIDQASLMASGDNTETGCYELYQTALMLKTMDAKISGKSDVTEQGMIDVWDVSYATSKTAKFSAVGQYDVQFLNEDCSWEFFGNEQLNADGSGMYSETEEGFDCTLYETQYQWQLTNGLLEQTATEAGYRDSCEQALVEDELFDFSCQIISSDETGFYCLYREDEDDYQELYHYQVK